MKKTSQRSLLFRQNVNRTEAEWRRACSSHGRRGMRTRLRPRRRAVDRAAMRSDGNNFRQLALRRKVAGDVPAICSVKAKICWTLARIEYYCAPLEFVANKVKRGNEICVARYDDKCVGCICVGIAKKRGGEIDICSFFLNLYHMDKTVRGCWAFLTPKINRWNPCLVFIVVAFYDISTAMSNNGLKVDVLALNRCGVVRICLGTGDEVLDGGKFVVFVKMGMDEHSVDKCNDIEPFAGREPAQQSMVEIAAVNIGNCFHLLSSKKIGPQTLRSKTLFRVGRTVRLDMNRLTGSAGIVPNIRLWRNGARRQTKILTHCFRYVCYNAFAKGTQTWRLDNA